MDDLSPEDAWISQLDLTSFKREIKALGVKLASEQGKDDLDHLYKMVLWSDSLTFLGFILTPLLPWYSLVPAICLAIGVTSRWTMVAHHACHGGYDKLGDSRYNRFRFGVGSLWRRTLDWFDWFLPEAWNVEHNQLHHYKLGEESDPDLVERNMSAIRNNKEQSFIIKYMMISFVISTWKWWYYAPNTFKALRMVEMRRENPQQLKKEAARLDLETPLVLTGFFTQALFSTFQSKGKTANSDHPQFVSFIDFSFRVMLPFALYRFVMLPIIPCMAAYYLGLGDCNMTAYFNCIYHFFLADIFANIHSFIIIGTNHCGNDLYRFSKSCVFGSGTFYLRQVISSANFDAGTDVIDFLHGFLNYQVEHHLWPNLSMLSYRKAMPQVKIICQKYNIPYVQENVFKRLVKTINIMTGATSMRPYPLDRERDE